MFEKHLTNPFLTSRLSDDKFSKLTQGHIETAKLLNTNGSPYAALFADNLTSTQTIFKSYNDSLSGKALNKAQREGKTIVVYTGIQSIKKFISSKEGVIKDKFPKGSPVYEELYPKGIGEYSKANVENMARLLKRFIDALTAHQGEIDKSILDQAQAYYDSFTQTRQAQLSKKGEVKDGSTASETLRKQLSVQLFKNMLLLLLIYVDNPEKVKDYFDEAFIKKSSPHVDAGSNNVQSAVAPAK